MSNNDLHVKPSSDGWATEAISAISAGRGVVITVSGSVAMEAMARVVRHAASRRAHKFAESVASLMSTVPLPADSSMLVAIGAVGGMLATVATVAAIGASEGRQVSVTWKLNKPFDPTDDEFVVYIKGE